MFEDASKEEMEWADYLFKGFVPKEGEEQTGMLGLNEDILKTYMKYLTNKRMKALKLKPIFEDTKNPIPWINFWTSSKGVQNAPQETEIESYTIGSFKNDVQDEDFGDFDI